MTTPSIAWPVTNANRTAARNATRHLIDYLHHTRGLTREDAYVLSSVAAELRISQIVDAPNWTVTAFLPLAIFEP